MAKPSMRQNNVVGIKLIKPAHSKVLMVRIGSLYRILKLVFMANTASFNANLEFLERIARRARYLS